MSKGPGAVERVIMATLEGEPDSALTVEDLCEVVWPAANRIEKKHRVSVTRAMRSVVTKGGRRAIIPAQMTGNTLIIYDPCNLSSTRMAGLKVDSFYAYRRRGPWRRGPFSRDAEEARILSRFEEDTRNAMIEQRWQKDVALAVAVRAGDTETVTAIRKRREADFAEWTKATGELAGTIGKVPALRR